MDVKKTIKIVTTIIPILTLIGTTALWVDTRYMHKQISDTRYIDLQIKIVQGQIRDYQRLVDSGIAPSAVDESNYDTDMKQLDHLLKERNRLLGL